MSLRGWAAAGGLVVLLAASGVVSATTPTETQWEQPFRVSAPFGERAEGRNIIGTVHGASLADTIEDAAWQSGDGSVWLVVDAGLESRSGPAVVAYGMLVVGERIFSASERPRADTMRRVGLEPGIPTRGVFVFELPADIVDDAAASSAELQLGVDVDPRLDSLLVTPIDLTQLDRTAVQEIVASEWGRG